MKKILILVSMLTVAAACAVLLPTAFRHDPPKKADVVQALEAKWSAGTAYP